MGGLVDKTVTLSLEDLRKGARPAGLHLMECSGNTRATRFGMISVADWSGAPISDLLELCKSKPQATRVVDSGFDTYSASSATSLPGADWEHRDRHRRLQIGRAHVRSPVTVQY